MTESSGLNEDAISDEQKPGFWNPALRPEDDQNEQSRLIEDFTSEDTSWHVSGHQMLAGGIQNLTVNKSSDLEIPNNVEVQEPASKPSLLQQSHLQDSSYKPTIIDAVDRPMLHSKSDSAADQHFDQKPTTPTPQSLSGIKLEEEERANFASVQESDFLAESQAENDQMENPSRLRHRKQTDLGNLLGSVQRTSTFPRPLDDINTASTPSYEENLPESQAENIMREDETGTGSKMISHFELGEGDSSIPEILNRFNQDANGDEFSFFENTVRQESTVANEHGQEEARFEEGLPLIASRSQSIDSLKDDTAHFSSLDEIFEDSRYGNSENVLGQTGQVPDPDANPQEHHPFTRKTTSDVITRLGPDPSVREDHPNHLNAVTNEQLEKYSKAVVGNVAPKDPVSDVPDKWKTMLDDEEFFIEDADDLLPDSDSESNSSFSDQLQGGDYPIADKSIPRQPPNSQLQGQQSNGAKTFSNPYAPHQPSTSDLTQGLSASTWGNVGLSQNGLHAMTIGADKSAQQSRPQAVARAESFADQSKGGYKSPYDLPIDIAKSRRRPQAAKPAMLPTSNKPPPPPRSSSMVSDTSASSMSGQPQLSPSNTRPPASYRPHSLGLNKIADSATTTHKPSQSSTPSTPSFFEELPISSRPRPPTAQGRYTPQTAMSPPKGPPPVRDPTIGAPPLSDSRPSGPPKSQTPSYHSGLKTSTDQYPQYQLQKPARLDPFSNAPIQNKPEPPPLTSRFSTSPPAYQAVSRPVVPSRYSPAPALSSNVPPRNRYVSQPSTSPMPPPPSLPFQPRTSSPLAHHERIQPPPQIVANGLRPNVSPGDGHTVGSEAQPGAVELQDSRGEDIGDSQAMDPAASSIEARAFQRLPQPLHQSPHQAMDPAVVNQHFSPPKRSQTSSPGKRESRLSQYAMPEAYGVQRPVSAQGQTSPVKSDGHLTDLPIRPSVRQRGLTQSSAFIPPQDSQQLDELQRWRGSPICRFGFGGSIITSFPKRIPRYVAGRATPMIKPLGGNVKIGPVKDFLSFVEPVGKFPGPLRSKSKKKDLLIWLSGRVAALQHEASQASRSPQLPDPQKRHEEKIILWKLVRAIVEYDGTIEGKPEALKAIGAIISPELEAQETMSEAMYGPGSNLSGIHQPVGSTHQSQPLDTSAIETIRKNLLQGDREKAVWDAVDAGLWAHAMLIASTLDKQIWKQVVQEFVRQEVKPVGMNTESLAALYEIFAGNLHESVDELVPPSARAGLQMVSKVPTAGPTKNALEGLDRWRETLTLVLNNRSPNDHEALATMGRLLAGYGRIEAAHSCFLFCRALTLSSVFGASDDPQTSIVLLGADQRQGADISFDEDAILLTEAYEFATSLLPGNAVASTAMPHLQAFKLQHAFILAENGFKSEAQQYCDAIAGSLKATTKTSPYHHMQFFNQLDDLTKRLQQAPIDGSSSWMSKPSMEKVSGSMWNKFSNFIAGDESDAASTGSGKEVNNDFGPFAKMSGTPTVSRSPSVSDLYGTYSGAPSTVPANGPVSRYAPSGQYAPNNQHITRSSSELQGSRTSLDSQRLPTYLAGQVQGSPSFDTGTLGQGAYQQPYVPGPYQPSTQSPPQTRYQATPPQSSYTPAQKLESQQQPSYSSGSYIPTPPADQTLNQTLSSSPATSYPFQLGQPSNSDLVKEDQSSSSEGSSGYSSSNVPVQDHDLQPPSTGQEQQPYSVYGNYDPYATNTYKPYVPDPDSLGSPPVSPEKSQVAPSNEPTELANTTSPPNRIARDQEVDDAFRRAAEADAARDKKAGPGDKTLKTKSSWFGSWFKGNNDDLNKTADSAGSKVIRAKLGEESSFYYDPDLKKWVNRKDPGSATANTRATPPPPKATPPSRSISGTGLSAPPPTSRLASSTSMPVLNAPVAGGPPISRSETPASQTGSLGEASGNGGEGGLAPPAKPPLSRPSSTMSNASNIDDLLGGPPQARKAGAGGTVKGKKKGRGYVDVMAK